MRGCRAGRGPGAWYGRRSGGTRARGHGRCRCGRRAHADRRSAPLPDRPRPARAGRAGSAPERVGGGVEGGEHDVLGSRTRPGCGCSDGQPWRHRRRCRRSRRPAIVRRRRRRRRGGRAPRTLGFSLCGGVSRCGRHEQECQGGRRCELPRGAGDRGRPLGLAVAADPGDRQAQRTGPLLSRDRFSSAGTCRARVSAAAVPSRVARAHIVSTRERSGEEACPERHACGAVPLAGPARSPGATAHAGRPLGAGASYTGSPLRALSGWRACDRRTRRHPPVSEHADPSGTNRATRATMGP